MKGLFIETPAFERLLPNYLSDDDYCELQQALLSKPQAGAVIQGTGGIRKIRWAPQGSGKRGGLRVIYYVHSAKTRFYMLTLYKKGEVSDLSPSEKKTLKRLVEVLENE
ncbi:type II toxin-antitoxin system RelE/ParE family toxin [Maricurvus nonylphenolicus]|uniref:type II toxin-antitoxin system RelE/ParE family toxin n=1 Tax=Maricurvus nonylphenolicus TaxID=1008307 RepID=UPI0036F22618